MKERPILFSAPMVRATLDDRKTQTRRIIKSPSRKHPCFALADYGKGWWPYLSDDGESSITSDGNETEIQCPYGVHGDRLWVRETWLQHSKPADIAYRASIGSDGDSDGVFGAMHGGWKSSIHMPRWASRITLEVTSVRVERLQDISESDAMAEGVSKDEVENCLMMAEAMGVREPAPARECFSLMWDSLHGQGSWWSWAANPWVWAISFRRLDGAAQEKA